MGAKQSTHVDRTFIHVSRSQRGSVDDSFTIDDRLTKSHLDEPHMIHSPYSSHLSTMSIKEDEELYLAEMPGTFENLSYLEDDDVRQNSYDSCKIGVAGGAVLVSKEVECSRMRVSLSACLDVERQGVAGQLGRVSNACSPAPSTFSNYSLPVRSPVSPVGPVLLRHPTMIMPVACDRQANSNMVTPLDSLVNKKKHPDRRSVEKVTREKRTEGFTVNTEDSSTWTTRMLRNLPNDYSRQDLLDLLDAQNVQFDFVYLPIDWGKRANLGYAFVNLVCPEEAVRIDSVLNGFTGWHVASDKVCEVVWGKPDQQSLRKNVERFRNSPVMHPDVPDEFKPMLFTLKRRSVFPAPTKRLRPPRGFKGMATALQPGALSSLGPREDSA